MSELDVFKIRVFQNVFFHNQILVGLSSHVQDANQLDGVLEFKSGQSIPNNFFIHEFIDDPDCVLYLVNNFELGPVSGYLFRRKVQLLNAGFPVDQDLGIDVLLSAGISLVDGQSMVFVVEGLLQSGLGLGG
jgi:hypothetical protein